MATTSEPQNSKGNVKTSTVISSLYLFVYNFFQVLGLLYGENSRYFETEVMPKIKHNKPGLISMVNCGNNMLGSQFFITLGEELLSLDGEHCVFGEIAEGIEIIHKLNEAICDHQHRPYKDIRITHTVILEDPFEDPSGLIVPDMSPEATKERLANGRIGADEEIDETVGLTVAEVEELRQEREAKARATILEIVGDLPDADVAPPENVLFVCKLNPVTTDEELEIIFNRFGKVKSCEIIRDKTTGDSLQYAFVEFYDQNSCEEAYFKMDNVVIDDRRIHVDFSQSTAKERKMRWKGKGKGIENLDQEDSNDIKGNKQRDRDDSRSWSSNRRERSYEDRDRRRERGREKEEDRQAKEEKGKEKTIEDRQRRRREKDRSRSEDSEYKGKEKNSEDRRRRRRDRSRSPYRKRDSQHKRDNHWEDDKRHENKRRENKSSRKKEEDTNTISSSTSSKRVDDKSLINKRVEDRKSDELKKEIEKRDPDGKSYSTSTDLIKRKSTEDLEIKNLLFDKSLNKEKLNLRHSVSVTDKSKGDKLIERCNNSKEAFVVSENKEDSSCSMQVNDLKEKVPSKLQICSTDTKIVDKQKVRKVELERDNSSDRTLTQKSIDKTDMKNQTYYKKQTLKAKKNHLSETRKRKKRRYSSSSDSSSETTDSSESSSSSDSSSYRHSKKKKLIIAKRYYRGGKLIKEIKKKKRTHETSDSESLSNESSDYESKKKHKKNKKKLSDDSLSESSSDGSDTAKYKKKKRKSEKYAKKKSRYSSPKKKKKRKESSGSSDSDSIKSKTNLIKKQKEIHKR